MLKLVVQIHIGCQPFLESLIFTQHLYMYGLPLFTTSMKNVFQNCIGM